MSDTCSHCGMKGHSIQVCAKLRLETVKHPIAGPLTGGVQSILVSDVQPSSAASEPMSARAWLQTQKNFEFRDTFAQMEAYAAYRESPLLERIRHLEEELRAKP